MLARQDGINISKIAQKIDRSPATISRELRRSGGAQYDATIANAAYKTRRSYCRKHKKLCEGTEIFSYVQEKLIEKQWSPRQITESLQNIPKEKRPGTVCPETIYAAIYTKPAGTLYKSMMQNLRQSKAKRGRRRKTGTNASFIPEEKRISQRPQEVEQRKVPGHWEGDFIKGAYNRSGIGVLVERKTRYVVLCRMNGCTADDALEGFTRQMRKIPVEIRKSMTYDRGSEMACHDILSKRLNIDIWFCEPHSPWQRGTNENTNGLLRQYLPKGSDLSIYSQKALNNIAEKLNTRPKKVLNWKTPKQMLHKEIKNLNKKFIPP